MPRFRIKRDQRFIFDDQHIGLQVSRKFGAPALYQSFRFVFAARQDESKLGVGKSFERFK